MGIRGTNRFLSRLCTVSDASFFILDIQTPVFFPSHKAAPRISYFDFQAPLKNLEMRGIDARTYGMRSELSTICATSPLMKRWAYDIWSPSSVNAIVGRSRLLHIVLKLALSLRAINPCVSHMPIACTFDWDASLVVSKGAIYFICRSLILLSVE